MSSIIFDARRECGDVASPNAARQKLDVRFVSSGRSLCGSRFDRLGSIWKNRARFRWPRCKDRNSRHCERSRAGDRLAVGIDRVKRA